MINSGLILMGIGMGIVFSFLIILVFSIKFMSWVIIKFLPEKEVVIEEKVSSNDVDVAIAVAVAKSME